MSFSEENISTSTFIIEKDRKNLGGHPDSLSLSKSLFKADPTIIRQFLSKILSDDSEKIKSNKKRKHNTYRKLDQYVSIIELDQQKIKRIHFAWAKAFAICGISWNIIKNPFFIETLKETNLSYKSPTYQFLS
ncbi:2616_t:CDS:2, partial [Cetraspora pellucida]